MSAELPEQRPPNPTWRRCYCTKCRGNFVSRSTAARHGNIREDPAFSRAPVPLTPLQLAANQRSGGLADVPHGSADGRHGAGPSAIARTSTGNGADQVNSPSGSKRVLELDAHETGEDGEEDLEARAKRPRQDSPVSQVSEMEDTAANHGGSEPYHGSFPMDDEASVDEHQQNENEEDSQIEPDGSDMDREPGENQDQDENDDDRSMSVEEEESSDEDVPMDAAGLTFKAYCIRTLCQQYDFFLYCSGGWKPELFCQIKWGDWARTRLPEYIKEQKEERKRSAQEVISISDDEESSVPTKKVKAGKFAPVKSEKGATHAKKDADTKTNLKKPVAPTPPVQPPVDENRSRSGSPLSPAPPSPPSKSPHQQAVPQKKGASILSGVKVNIDPSIIVDRKTPPPAPPADSEKPTEKKKGKLAGSADTAPKARAAKKAPLAKVTKANTAKNLYLVDYYKENEPIAKEAYDEIWKQLPKDIKLKYEKNSLAAKPPANRKGKTSKGKGKSTKASKAIEVVEKAQEPEQDDGNEEDDDDETDDE